VDGAGAEAVDGGDVYRVVVAEVLIESIAWVEGVCFDHETVAGDFCEDGRGGNCGIF
jgi:hypothetical protein